MRAATHKKKTVVRTTASGWMLCTVCHLTLQWQCAIMRRKSCPAQNKKKKRRRRLVSHSDTRQCLSDRVRVWHYTVYSLHWQWHSHSVIQFQVTASLSVSVSGWGRRRTQVPGYAVTSCRTPPPPFAKTHRCAIDLCLCLCLSCPMGPFKCYVTQMGVGGCLIFWKKALRRCNVQCY